ncbi:MAG: hypothetical protein KC493_09585 [Bacteriovoracaceae bacterium]|nr:hypothetical protein [Bacteriovoracaceae bacterium]
MNKVIFLFLIFSFASCTGHLSLANRGCSKDNNILIVKKNDRYPVKVRIEGKSFFVKTKIYTGSKFLSTPEKFKIADILAEHGIDCNNVKNISITTKTTGWENIIGLIPFVSGKTLIIEGELSHIVTEDDADKEKSKGEPSS